MSPRIVLLGCAQDAGLPQLGCDCRQCNYARSHPEFKDAMVACLGIVDEEEGKVFLVDATPNLRSQLWSMQHFERKDGSNRPLELGGILLTHAHTGHYTGLLQLGKEEADMRDVPVFCTPRMASFLRNNQPWAQLTERGNISIRETNPAIGGSDSGGAIRLTSAVSALPVDVPHRAELADTVAYLISITQPSAQHVIVDRAAALSPFDEVESKNGRSGESAPTMNLFYCPDTDGWSGWRRSIQDWCEEVDVALLDATFYDKQELKGRDMSEVSHPIVKDTMKELADCKAEVVLVHLNHTNPLFAMDSSERAQTLAAGFVVGTFGMEWTLPN